MAASLWYLPYSVVVVGSFATPGATITFYTTGTTTKAPIYTTSALTVEHANPVIANGAGRFADIYLNDALTYRAVIKDATGTVLEDIDPYIPGVTSQTITTPSGASVPTRALLAAIATPDPSQSATLTESGREGTFVFSTANLSTQVTADTRQGIYVAPSTDTTGASGAWVRKFGGPASVHWFGALGDGTTDDYAAITAAISAIDTLGAKALRFEPGKTYLHNSGLVFNKAGLVIEGYGATLKTPYATTSSAVFFSGSNIVVRGLTVWLTDTTGMPYVAVGGADVHFIDVAIQRDATSGIPFYLTSAGGGVKADGFTWRGGELNAYGGLNALSCSHVLLDGVYFHQPDGGATDDAIAIKSIDAEVVDWRISNCRYRNKSEFVAIGSEVGVFGANDSTYSRGVYGVLVENCYGENCTTIAYIKPGLQYDYRDGTVDGVNIVNCHMRDLTGAFARNLLFITSSRGARVRNVNIKNCTAKYRCPDRLGSGNAAVLILSTTFTGGTATAEIDNIFVDGVSVTDPYGGVANGTGGTSGYPIDNFVSIDGSTGSGGPTTIIKRLEVTDFHGDGCARNGMQVTTSASVTGPLILRNPVLRNHTAAELGSTDRAAISNPGGKVEVHGLQSYPAATANAATRGVMGDSQSDKTVEIVGEKTQPVTFATVSAGNGVSGAPLFTAPVDCWIRKIELICSAATTQNDTNYTSIDVRNKSTGASVVTATTKVTGGIAIPAQAVVSLNGTTQFTGANAYLPKGSALTWNKIETGTGAALNFPAFIVHYVPYGAA